MQRIEGFNTIILRCKLFSCYAFYVCHTTRCSWQYDARYDTVLVTYDGHIYVAISYCPSSTVSYRAKYCHEHLCHFVTSGGSRTTPAAYRDTRLRIRRRGRHRPRRYDTTSQLLQPRGVWQNPARVASLDASSLHTHLRRATHQREQQHSSRCALWVTAVHVM